MRDKSNGTPLNGVVQGRNCFVFVVCGAKDYIDTLHYTLSALRRKSHSDILVLTDSRRNEIPIVWPKIVDIQTPDEFNHHQASIYLKTGIHRFLPVGPTYCYLDTDVVATSPDVDQIFALKADTIIFAPDHSRTHVFSRYAVRCSCSDKIAAMRSELNDLKSRAWNVRSETPEEERLRTVLTDFERLRANVAHYGGTYLKFLMTRPSPSNREDAADERWRCFWFETQETGIHFERSSVIAEVERISNWRWDQIRHSWISPDGTDIYNPHCDHLVEAIKTTFGIEVRERRWQHWNGGVFVFDERGHKFLDAWHEKTIQIFREPEWKIRDQGTLIATCWEFGLQHARTLPHKFNLVLDSENRRLKLSCDNQYITTDAFITKQIPIFAHVLSRFGDETWDVWRWVDRHAETGTRP